MHQSRAPGEEEAAAGAEGGGMVADVAAGARVAAAAAAAAVGVREADSGVNCSGLSCIFLEPL